MKIVANEIKDQIKCWVKASSKSNIYVYRNTDENETYFYLQILEINEKRKWDYQHNDTGHSALSNTLF